MTLGIFKQGSVYDKFLIRLAVRGNTPTVHFQFLELLLVFLLAKNTNRFFPEF